MKHIFLLLALAALTHAQRGGGNNQNPPLAPLKSVPRPATPGLDRYVQNKDALIALGKVFFWDVQAGSDGRTACATCHFHAGADHRLQNQLSGPAATLNHRLTAEDFPFHQLSNPGNNNSAVLSDKRQVAGSMGVVSKAFSGIDPGSLADLATNLSTPAQFLPNGVAIRQVTSRNTPSVINAVYNVRNFWDGRASRIFTGATPFGDSDASLHALVLREDGKLYRESIRVENASLASQAVGPALNAVEMSWSGRSWTQLGRKLRYLQPLGRQQVAPSDSVLGAYANLEGNGLRAEFSYDALIHAAFRPEFWSAGEVQDGFFQIEHNFALFWGLAIHAYEATLISDDTRVDRFLQGETTALTALEQQGLNEFRGGASQCTNCHNGPELSSAGWTAFARRNPLNTNPGAEGFFRIGVTPLADDAGLGGHDDFGIPLFAPNPAAANGTFKTPGLRNVEFTGPYFHDGGQATLDQVLRFYSRNGDFPGGGNLGPGIGNIRLGNNDRNAIVAFLKALTDDRVKYQRAPFDHPSICVPDGHLETAPGQFELDTTQTGSVAADRWALVPAVGQEGSSVPLQTFEEMLAGVGNDGSRANTMTTACRP
jgi:cytochrome c peroxidase